MSFVVVGLSHRGSPLELRERLHFPESAIPGALARLRERLSGAGVVILSTCNRVEVYVNHGGSPPFIEREIRHFLCEWHRVPEEEFAAALYVHEGRDAVGHLFRVASSLDSLVVGEGQILGQVHDAYLLAQTEQAADKVLHALFQKAFSVAKGVRTQTAIGQGTVSIGSVAVDLAVSIFTDLANKTVMVIGSGKMGQMALRNLVSRGLDRVLLVNRSMERARSLAEQFGGEALALSDLDGNLHRADIIIASTAAPEFLLRAADLEHALKRRNNQPIFVIDIAVPRNVDPAVDQIDNVYLYDIDSLQQVADANLQARREELDQAIERVEHGVDQFWRWMQAVVAEPTIVSMAEEVNAIRERELLRTLAALPELTDAQREEVTYLTQRIVNNILQRPMSQIKHEVAHHDPHTVLHLVKRLFGLEEQ